jgi:hypothetical protein
MADTDGGVEEERGGFGVVDTVIADFATTGFVDAHQNPANRGLAINRNEKEAKNPPHDDVNR